MTIAALIAVLLLFVAAALELRRSLPAQNIAMILVVLMAGEAAAEAVWTGRAPSWRACLFWPAAIVLARAAGRWGLRRRRTNYGLRLVFVGGAAAALAQLALALPGASWAAALKLAAARFGLTAVCLFWLAPWFISKFPRQPKDHACQEAEQ
jgi:hypothetical protein